MATTTTEVGGNGLGAAPAPTEAAQQQALAKQEKSPVGFGKAGVMISNLAELWRFAEMVQQSGLSPKGLDTPQKVAVAIQYGAEFGVPPMASIRGVRVINGIPGWMGDMALGIVRASGKMAFYEKRLEGEGQARKAIVVTQRNDSAKPLETVFSVAEAILAGLWGKSGPWTQYPDRMLYYRALGFNLRDNFPDVMAGAAIAEELADIPIVDVTPSRVNGKQTAQALAAPQVSDALLASIGVQVPVTLVEPVVVPDKPAEPLTPAVDCSHPSVPPSKLKPGKTMVCRECGEELTGDVEK